MGKVIMVLALLLSSVLVLIIAYVVFVGVGAWQQGYTWKEMDWNQDGSTTIAEFFESSDIGKREIVLNGKECYEYFAYKDARIIKIDCHDFTDKKK